MILFRKNRYRAPATADYELSLIVEKKKHDFFLKLGNKFLQNRENFFPNNTDVVGENLFVQLLLHSIHPNNSKTLINKTKVSTIDQQTDESCLNYLWVNLVVLCFKVFQHRTL